MTKYPNTPQPEGQLADAVGNGAKRSGNYPKNDE
jgi:hypothetical protein